jgi:hypothetical protein
MSKNYIYMEPYAGPCKHKVLDNKEVCALVCGAPYCKDCGTHKDCWYKKRS